MSSEVRASIIVSAKDEASTSLKKIGDVGAKTGDDLRKGFSGAIQSATGLNLASLTLAGGIGLLGAGLKYAIDQAAEAEKIMAQTEAVVRSTGGAAGLTADQIANMSGRLSQLSAVDDEVIQSGANLLLTFKSVKADGFEPAMQAALDMSVAMGTDLRGNILQVGKALEDPIRGLTALRRSGVSFTQEQQNVIKALVNTGKAAEAQKLILAELNKQFGGSAAAGAKTFAGQMDLLRINVDNLAQTIGSRLIPGLTKAAEATNLLITWNEKLNDIYSQHRDEVTQTAATYEDYRDELLRAAVVAGKLTERQADNVRAGQQAVDTYQIGADSLRYYTEQVGLLTEAEFEASRAVVAVTASTDVYTNQLQSQTQWLEATAEAGKGVAASTYEVEKAQLRLNAALQAGLMGDLVQAQEDYRAVLAETAPEIANLTAQVGENNAALAELKLKNEEAAAAMRTATAEFLNNQLAASLTAEGQRKLAVELGLMSEADYLAATAAQNLTKMLDGTRASEDLMITATAALRDTINSLQSKNIDINISTFYREYRIASGAAPAGHEGDYGQAGNGSTGTTTNTGVPGDDRDRRASGGPVAGGGAYLVGERGPEMFFPNSGGTIVDANKTDRLIKAMERLADGSMGTTNNYYGYGNSDGDAGQRRAQAGALM